MAEERRTPGQSSPGRNGEERRQRERRHEEEEPQEERAESSDPGFQSKRSELHEGWYDRDRHAERGGEWGRREQDRGEEYGSMHRAHAAPPRGPWRAADYPEYGGAEPRAEPVSRREMMEGRAYPRGDSPFQHRERPGFQAMHGESGLGMRHREHLVRPHLDEGLSARERGGFAGRGPRGYRRSDERIWEDVCEHLTHASSVDASDLEVTVQQGEVTLEGFVASREEKRAAEDISEWVAGVVDVHNRLRLRPLGH